MAASGPGYDGRRARGRRIFSSYNLNFLLDYISRRCYNIRIPLVEGVSGNDPKTERDVAGDRHGGAPKGERVARGFARRDPHVTRAAHTRACRRDNDK